LNFVLFCCFDPGHGNHYQVARMSMISVFVCYFFLTKMFVCIFVLFLLRPRSVPVVVGSGGAPGDRPSRRFFFSWRRRPQSLLRRCSESKEVVPFLFSCTSTAVGRGGAPRHRSSKSMDSFSLGAESSSTAVAPPEVSRPASA